MNDKWTSYSCELFLQKISFVSTAINESSESLLMHPATNFPWLCSIMASRQDLVYGFLPWYKQRRNSADGYPRTLPILDDPWYRERSVTRSTSLLGLSLSVQGASCLKASAFSAVAKPLVRVSVNELEVEMAKAK